MGSRPTPGGFTPPQLTCTCRRARRPSTPPTRARAASRPAADGNARVDDPAVVNTGAGPRAYDDRGAYEFLPGPAPAVRRARGRAHLGPPPPRDHGRCLGLERSRRHDRQLPLQLRRRLPGVGPQSAATAAHTYTQATYTVTVTVTDTPGSAPRPRDRSRPPSATDRPSAALTVTPSSGLVSLQVTADASASSDAEGPIASYAFDFGDGSPIVGPQAGATADTPTPRPGRTR